MTSFLKCLQTKGSEALPTIGSLVGGEILNGKGEDIVLFTPATGKEFRAFSDPGSDIVAQATDTVTHGAREWRALAPTRRGEILWDASKTISGYLEPLAQLEASTSGKPIRDTRAEVAKVRDMFAYYAGWCDKLHGDVIPVPTSHLNYTLHVPYGVVAQITPWNAPIFTAGWQMAPALATGNGVILKPSELTPITSIMLGELLIQAGVPSNAIAVIAGRGPTSGHELVVSTNVHKVVFVGSVDAGRKIAQAAAQAPKPCVLELGGKSANIVFADANLERAAAGVAAGVFGAAGQSCVAGSRLLVQRTIYDTFVDMVSSIAKNIRLGDPRTDATQMGPISSRNQLDIIETLVSNAVSDGAQATTGGRRACVRGFEDGFFFEPTVLSNVTNCMEISRREVFGPVVVAIPFDEEADAVAIANDSDFGLAGAVWTNDIARAHRIAAQVDAGTFWINSYKAINVMSPFGGFKKSGYGRSSGREGLQEYLQLKSVWIETSPNPEYQFDY